MLFEETGFSGLLLVKPRVFADERGYFMEAFTQRAFREAGIDINFVQDNQSSSSKGVVRGLHFQNKPHAQAKLIRVLAGEIRDIVLDLRRSEPTFGKVFTGVLSSSNKHQLLIPKGFAHGFVVLSNVAEVMYKCDDYYYPETEGGINVFDPALGVEDLSPGSGHLQSAKDRILPSLAEAIFNF